MFDKQSLAELEEELGKIFDADDSLTFAELAEIIQLDLKKDLQGVDLQEIELQGIDLRGADLRETHLDRADLTGALLSKANLRSASFRDARLNGAVLDEAILVGGDLTRADLANASLRNANLEGTSFIGVNLADTDLAGAQLKDAVFVEANPSGISGREQAMVAEVPDIWPFASQASRRGVEKSLHEQLEALLRPRLAIISGAPNLSALVIENRSGRVLASVSAGDTSIQKQLAGAKDAERDEYRSGEIVGRTIAERIRGMGIDKVEFDLTSHVLSMTVTAIARGLQSGDVTVITNSALTLLKDKGIEIDNRFNAAGNENLIKGLLE